MQQLSWKCILLRISIRHWKMKTLLDHDHIKYRFSSQTIMIIPFVLRSSGVSSAVFHLAFWCSFSKGEEHVSSPFQWDFVGKNLVAMAVQGVAFYFLNLLMQHRLFSTRWWCLKSCINVPLLAVYLCYYLCPFFLFLWIDQLFLFPFYLLEFILICSYPGARKQLKIYIILIGFRNILLKKWVFLN